MALKGAQERLKPVILSLGLGVLPKISRAQSLSFKELT